MNNHRCGLDSAGSRLSWILAAATLCLALAYSCQADCSLHITLLETIALLDNADCLNLESLATVEKCHIADNNRELTGNLYEFVAKLLRIQ